MKKRPFNPQKLLLVLELGAWQVRPLRTFCAAYDPAAPTPRAKLELETVTGEEAQAALPDLARLRIEVFREFPYLYDGDEAHERDYLQTYVRVKGAAIVLARIGERIVGAATCLPLSAETQAVKTPFLEAGIDISDIFYFGESVLEKAYRGRGLGLGFSSRASARPAPMAPPWRRSAPCSAPPAIGCARMATSRWMDSGPSAASQGARIWSAR
ncbi:GNAT family N-acetyltransferase [Acidocella sp. MX-AZ03]|uniref:GNAT family N-acetyltransferase n=1 Tax=Acidocella sp. MX-AZ03 TaxID=2697363 RepID=UPI0022DE83E4|nr:GNAT family N-acetyltransferase [Acidocella sp. MX-AZ03]WBO60379.1 GNAT family N-acetyltransferase [Acidocella sp. MX-AZ03]